MDELQTCNGKPCQVRNWSLALETIGATGLEEIQDYSCQTLAPMLENSDNKPFALEVSIG